MITSPPIALVANTPVTVSDPATVGSSAVQIQNQTGFILSVLANGELTVVQPLTVVTIPLAGDTAPVTIRPSILASTVQTDELIMVWLATGDTPPQDDGPLPATSVGVAITGGSVNITGGTVDVNPGTSPLLVGPQEAEITSGVTGASGGTGWVLTGITIPPGVNTFVLILGPNVGFVPGVSAYSYGDVTDAVQIVQWPNKFPPGTIFPVVGGVSFPFPVFPALDAHQAIQFPAAVPAGTPYWIMGSNDYYVQTVDVAGQVALASGSTVAVENALAGGDTSPLDVVPYGGLTHLTSGAIANGATWNALLAAAAGHAYRLHRLCQFGGPGGPPAGPSSLLTAVTNVGIGGIPGGEFVDRLDGLVTAEVVNVLNLTGASAAYTLVYDNILLPVIS